MIQVLWCTCKDGWQKHNAPMIEFNHIFVLFDQNGDLARHIIYYHTMSLSTVLNIIFVPWQSKFRKHHGKWMIVTEQYLHKRGHQCGSSKQKLYKFRYIFLWGSCMQLWKSVQTWNLAWLFACLSLTCLPDSIFTVDWIKFFYASTVKTSNTVCTSIDLWEHDSF